MLINFKLKTPPQIINNIVTYIPVISVKFTYTQTNSDETLRFFSLQQNMQTVMIFSLPKTLILTHYFIITMERKHHKLLGVIMA
jgi:hypothetical protein